MMTIVMHSTWDIDIEIKERTDFEPDREFGRRNWCDSGAVNGGGKSSTFWKPCGGSIVATMWQYRRKQKMTVYLCKYVIYHSE